MHSVISLLISYKTNFINLLYVINFKLNQFNIEKYYTKKKFILINSLF
jgi:hypothetical protein